MNSPDQRVADLLKKMTLREKIGQMCQGSGPTGENREWVRKGEMGSLLNIATAEEINEFQRISVNETRLGIPLLIGRDVIHGYQTTFPIPLAQSCSWNTSLVEKAARIAAQEASRRGIRWVFSPMVDVSRDPRWGRVAEGAGEDPYLAGEMGAAMVRGYQGKDLSHPDSVAACAKHFVGYGASEAGREYNSTEISERTLREVYLRPFKACLDAGAATMMSGFNDISGIPASGNAFALRQVLRKEWHFDGMVVSDWESIKEMIVHGFCADAREAARDGVLAGVDMEMLSTCYRDRLEDLIISGEVPMSLVDDSVRAILKLKFRLGLFENNQVDLTAITSKPKPEHQETARQLARESCVLLRNEGSLLPLSKNIRSLAVIGPMADHPSDQLGCWTMDGKPEDACTPLTALNELTGTKIHFARGLTDTACRDTSGIAEAVEAARNAEVSVLFLGEGANMSGEARSRAFLDLPGAQTELLKQVQALGKPLVVVLMTGRPMTLPWASTVPALLLAWHPGAMGGPAIADLLFGDHAPSGKLTMSFPRAVGQIPVYYNHKNTGRPLQDNMRSITLGTPDNPVGFCSHYLDVENTPLFPFGFGLGYSTVEYGPTRVTLEGNRIHVQTNLSNTGPREHWEVAQLYVRDIAGSVTRPIKELKGFRRFHLKAGESRTLEFTLLTEDLAFYGRDCDLKTEPGDFEVWIAGDSNGGTAARFNLKI